MVNVSINVMVNLHLNLAGPPCPNKIHEEYERVSETEGEREILRNWFITGGLYMYLYIYKCTRFLRNLHAGQEAIVTTGHGTTDWFQIGKGVGEGTILSPCLFNLYTEYIMQNSELDEAQAGIKITRENISNLRYADENTLKTESKEELRTL